MTVDISKIKPGDEVLVRAAVVSVSDAARGGGIVTLQTDDGAPEQFQSYLSGITTHTPILKEGDRVTISGGCHWTARLLATSDGLAWIRREDGRADGEIHKLSDLERVDGAPGEVP